MRRAYRKVLPALSRIYGLQWDDVFRMPRGELEAYLDDLHQMGRKR